MQIKSKIILCMEFQTDSKELLSNSFHSTRILLFYIFDMQTTDNIFATVGQICVKQAFKTG